MKIFRYLVVPPIVALFIFVTSTFIIYQLVSLAPTGDIREAAAPLGSYTEWLFGGTFSRGVMNGDFGLSLRVNQPASEVYQERLPATLELFGLTVLGSLAVGIPVGAFMAYARRRLTDGFIRPFVWLADSLPHFWVALMLILIFAVQQGMYPASGRCGAGSSDCAEHLTLPLWTLLIVWIPMIALYIRAAILRTYRGSASASIGLRLRDGLLLPLFAILPVFFAGVISSLMIVETVFAWPGVGRLAFESLLARDMPVLTAAVFIPACWIILSFLVFGLVSGLISLLTDKSADDQKPQREAPAQPPVAQEPVGLFAEETANAGVSARVWIDRVYTLVAIIAALILVGIAVVTFSPSVVTTADPLTLAPAERLLPPDSQSHPLGTDALGRDLQARLLYGGQTTLQIAIRATLIAVLIGAVVGFVAGLFMDTVGVILNIPIQVVVMALNLLPTLPFLGLAIAVFRPEPDTIALLLALVAWGSSVVSVRAKVAQFFDPKAKSGSLASWLFLPVYLFAANMAFFILVETSLEFLGIGVQPPTPSWGLLLADARSYMAQADYLIIAPGLLITLTIFCLFVVVNRLRDAFEYD